MWSLLPLTVYCISLLSFQQLLALPAEERPYRNRNLSHTVQHKHSADSEELKCQIMRNDCFCQTKNRWLDLLIKLIGQKDSNPPATETQTNSMVPSSAPSQPPEWLPEFPRHPPASEARTASPALAWAQPTEALQVERRVLRARRHAHSRGGHHAKLMRVGCVLGTCQVQNLSHRLYQLIGQSGREDSSPINPKSPHSYG